MSKGFQSSEYIGAPVEDVWRALTEWQQAHKWMNGIESMRGPDRRDIEPGSKVTFRARGADRESTITVWSPPKQLVLCSRQGGVTAVYEYTCSPEGEGARLTLQASCEMRGSGWRLIGPLIRYLMKRTDSGQPAALKRVFEASFDQGQ